MDKSLECLLGTIYIFLGGFTTKAKQDSFLFGWRKLADTSCFSALRGRCSGALGGASPLLQCHRLLAVQDDSGFANGGHVQVWAVLVFADHVLDAGEGGPGVLVDGGPHIGGDRLSLAGSPLHDDHHTFAFCRWLHAHCLAVNQLVVVEGVGGLPITELGAVHLLVPFDQETGAFVNTHLLQMCGHGDSSSCCGSQRQPKQGS